MAVGWAIATLVLPPRRRAVEPVILGAVAAAPDLDPLIGLHRMYLHSIGATLVVLIVARLTLGPGQWRLALGFRGGVAEAICPRLAQQRHLRALRVDGLWPFSDEALPVVPAPPSTRVSRRYWLPQSSSGTTWQPR